MSADTLEFTADPTADADGRLGITIRMGGQAHEVFYQTRDIRLTPSIEACLCMTLLPAMSQGAAVQARGPVSPRLLAATDRIMDVVCGWQPSLHRVKIEGAVPRSAAPAAGSRVGTFFSGGLDSFFTLLKHRDEITDLIHIYGFQRQPSDIALRQRTSELVRRAGAEFGKNVIEVESNYRSFLKPYVSHTHLAHGASLATVGHLLGPEFHRIYIAATYHRDALFPWGSHPDLDPLWSTESLDVVHDGCEATRVDKARLVAQSDIALQSLRVCHHNPRENLNCGECEKCIRTMINLAAVGGLERCHTFAKPLDIDRVKQLLAKTHGVEVFLTENLRALDESGSHPELAAAVRGVLNRPRWQMQTIATGRRIGRELMRISPVRAIVRQLQRRR